MTSFRKTIAWAIVAVVVVGALPSLAYGGWQKLNGPYGAYIADLSVDPSNPQIVYAAIDGGGVYKSYDGGVTWAEISVGISSLWGAWAVVFDPTDSQTLYIGTWGGGIFKSTDGGNTWQDISNEINNYANTVWDIAIHPTNPQIVYVITYAGVFKSTSGGHSWSQKSDGITFPEVFSIALDSIHPDILYVGTWLADTNYIFKTTNGGESWTPIYDNPANINSIAIDPVNSSIIYAGTEACAFKSTDGGVNWNESCGICPWWCITNPYLRDLTIDPLHPEIVYAATWGGLFKSIDAGTSWKSLSQDFKTQFVKTAVFDPSNSQTIYAGVWGGVYKSIDGGESWSFHSQGLPHHVKISDHGLAIDPINSGILFAGTFGGGTAKTKDGGCFWEYCNVGKLLPYDQPCSVDPNNPQIVYSGTDGGEVFYKSTNAGSTWVAHNVGLTTKCILQMSFDPTNSSIIYLATLDGAFKSTDGAQSWTPINEGLPTYHVQWIAVDPWNPQIVYAATHHEGIFKSTDGGESWFSSSVGLSSAWTRSIAIDVANPQTVYVGTKYAGVFKSTNGGENWDTSNSGIESTYVFTLAIDPANSQILYVGSRRDGVFRSTNGGNTWLQWNEGLTNFGMKDLILDPQNPSIVYVGTEAGVFRRGVRWKLAIDSVSCPYPGDRVDVSVNLCNLCSGVDIGGFKLYIEYDPTVLTKLDVVRGDLIDDFDGYYDEYGHCPRYLFQYFEHRQLPCEQQCETYKIKIVGIADMPDGWITGPVPAGKGELIKLKFKVAKDANLQDMFLPIKWEFDYDFDLKAPSFSSATGESLFVDVNWPGETGEGIFKIVTFVDGGVKVHSDAWCWDGDINMNEYPYEIADAVLFANYFLYGEEVFDIDPDIQILATDVNKDGVTLSISDFVFLIRIILEDISPKHKLVPSEYLVDVTLTTQGDAVKVVSNSNTSIGAGLYVFRHSGEVKNLITHTDMDVKYHAADGELRVLVYSFEGKAIPAGAAELFSFEGKDVELVQVEVTDFYGSALKSTIKTKVLPTEFLLMNNYPNPFNLSTSIRFALPIDSDVSLKIYNIAGQLVRSFEGDYEAGSHAVTWDGTNTKGETVASGIYFYKIRTRDFVQSKKMLLLK